jgi:hypothetical protein
MVPDDGGLPTNNVLRLGAKVISRQLVESIEEDSGWKPPTRAQILIAGTRTARSGLLFIL